MDEVRSLSLEDLSVRTHRFSRDSVTFELTASFLTSFSSTSYGYWMMTLFTNVLQ